MMPPRRLWRWCKTSVLDRVLPYSPEDEVEGGLLLDVVVAEGTAVLELLAGEDQALLVGGDAAKVRQYRAAAGPTIPK